MDVPPLSWKPSGPWLSPSLSGLASAGLHPVPLLAISPVNSAAEPSRFYRAGLTVMTFTS